MKPVGVAARENPGCPSCHLPENVIGVRRHVAVVFKARWEPVELSMRIAKEHDIETHTAVIVPKAAWVGGITVGGPGPIALDEFGDGFDREFRAFDRGPGRLIKFPGVARDVSRPERA